MITFIKEALQELEHVVWPTPNETKKYMNYTVGVIVVVAVFLAILGYGMREALSFTRSQFPHDTTQTQAVSGEDFATRAELEELTKQLQSKKSQTGANTPTTATGTSVKK